MPGSELHTHVAELRHKRDLALGLLRQIPALACPTPQGAFYLLPDVSAYFGKATPEGVRIGSAEALCMALLDKYKVALVPGEAFGAPATVRLSYAATRARERGARRLTLTTNEGNTEAQALYRSEGLAPASHARYPGGREVLWSVRLGGD